MDDATIIEHALAAVVQGQRTPAEVLGIDASIVDGLYDLGVRAHDMGKHLHADGIFQRCVALDPFAARNWIALAACRQAMERPLDAGELYQIAGLMTDDVRPIAYAAACFAEAGETDRALALAEHARRGNAGEVSIQPWLAVVEHYTGSAP